MNQNTHQQTSCVNFDLSKDIISSLEKNPNQAYHGSLFGHTYTARIIIPDYVSKVQVYYKDQLKNTIDDYVQSLKLPDIFDSFGVCIAFDEPTEIHLHNEEMQLQQSAKDLMTKFGAVVLHNVYLDSVMRDVGHRNRFPQLNFHIDRNPAQETHYSVYTRNPFCEDQKPPRTSMTVFIPYLVAYLQGIKEGKGNIACDDGLITRSELYTPAEVPDLLNSILLPHTWDQPEGVGEISMIDNANLLHASYYPNENNKGYRIGVRYVS